MMRETDDVFTEGPRNSITHATTPLSGSRMILAMLMWLVPVAPTLASMPQTPTESVCSTIEDVIRIQQRTVETS